MKKYKQKDFDGWNNKKKKIENLVSKKVRKGEVWWAFIGENIGFEQCGGKRYERPVVVLDRINYYLALIIPLTSNQKNSDSNFYIKLEGTSSTAILPQVRVISTKRLRRNIRTIDNKELLKLKSAVRKFFNL